MRRLRPMIRQIHESNFGVYGARKVWLALNRQGTAVARCTVERADARAGVVRCGPRPGQADHRRRSGGAAGPDLVLRDFRPLAPDKLWVADITYVSTWSGGCMSRS